MGLSKCAKMLAPLGAQSAYREEGGHCKAAHASAVISLPTLILIDSLGVCYVVCLSLSMIISQQKRLYLMFLLPLKQAKMDVRRIFCVVVFLVVLNTCAAKSTGTGYPFFYIVFLLLFLFVVGGGLI